MAWQLEAARLQDYRGLRTEGAPSHKAVRIATCGAARAANPEHLGTVGGGLEPVTKALRRLVSRGLRPHIVYEAGPCGFGLQRHLAALGWD